MSYDRLQVVADSRAVLARHARTFDLAGWFLPPERQGRSDGLVSNRGIERVEREVRTSLRGKGAGTAPELALCLAPCCLDAH